MQLSRRRRYPVALDRIRAQSTITDGCWLYDGTSKPDGYARIFSNGRERYIHNLSWEDYHGRPVPIGYVVHHICEKRNCWRPTHLELKERSQHVSEHNTGRTRSKYVQ